MKASVKQRKGLNKINQQHRLGNNSQALTSPRSTLNALLPLSNPQSRKVAPQASSFQEMITSNLQQGGATQLNSKVQPNDRLQQWKNMQTFYSRIKLGQSNHQPYTWKEGELPLVWTMVYSSTATWLPTYAWIKTSANLPQGTDCTTDKVTTTKPLLSQAQWHKWKESAWFMQV